MNSKIKVLSGIIALFFVCVFSSSSLHGEFQNQVGPFQVIVYSGPDFVGDSESFNFNMRSHRILLVNRFNKKLNDRVASIHVGSEVKAILFDHHDFHANWISKTKKIPILLPFGIPGGTKNYFEKFRNVDVFTESEPRIRSTFYGFTSMIVLPKDFKGTWGIALYNLENRFIRIEPIPDLKKHKLRVIPDFGSYLNDKIEIVKFLGTSTEGVKLIMYDGTHFKGNSISLPGMGSDKDYFYLRDYHFSRKTKSIKVKVADAGNNSARASAPPADNQISVVKEVIPIEGMIFKKVTPVPGGPKPADPPPPPGHTLEVMGPWHDGHGNDYELQQQGKAFSWFCPQRDEHGSGVFEQKGEFSVMWTNSKGKGQTRGRISKYNKEGMPIEIQMNTGVTLYRK